MCGDVGVGLEYWVARKTLHTSLPVGWGDLENEREARVTARIAPVLRAGHGAMWLYLREGADRSFLLRLAPSDCEFLFAAPRVLPKYPPRVFSHLAHRLATVIHDPLLGVAWLDTACAMVRALLEL